MPKRKISSGTLSGSGTDNPLSDARRQSHGNKQSGSRGSNGNNSKADQNAQNLWHRKSGAGYSLFVSYYGAQPLGVVADESANAGGDMANSRHRGGQQIGKGMSRAAKKRRKKRKLLDGGGAGASCASSSQKEQGDTSGTAVPAASVSSPALPALVDVSSHPLFQAFNSQSRQYPHLAPYIHALSRPLPLTFRLRNDGDNTSNNRNKVARKLAKEHSDLVGPVPYDPTQTIYQSSTQSSHLCKANLSKLSPSLKELLVSASMDGTLARQELGSMLPVLALTALNAIPPGSKVLDLCASPGSKTLQALEIASSPNPKNKKRGRVVANDVHTGRLDSLRDAVGRSGLDDALTSRVTYTNFDASIFPSPKSGKLFDAVIADVPCSGDGTIRKDRHVLPMWTPATGNSLHGLQVKILVRSLQLVKVGGFVCYSTCSLNPVEDEAVVAAALRRMNKDGGDSQSVAVELVDWPQTLLPGFRRRPGVDDWKVAFYEQDGDGSNGDEDDGGTNADFGNLQYYDFYEEAKEAGMNHVERTLWSDLVPGESPLCLKRCSRLWPQDQDTGGFFVALIRKNS